MRMSFPIFALLTALSACGTPQEQCISRETRDLRVVDRLIADTEGNVKRGYAFEDVVISRTVWVICAPLPVVPPVEGGPMPEPVNPQLCLDDREETVTRPVAIDLVAERSKLNGLKAKRTQLARDASRAITACRKAYPE
jgi:hypothetical protein